MNKIPFTLRAYKDEVFYRQAIQLGETIPLVEEPSLREWKFWRLIDNRYPYSTCFKKHHMLMPIRQAANRELLTALEQNELHQIMQELAPDYDIVFENTLKRQSQPGWLHIQLGEYYDDRTDLKL